MVIVVQLALSKISECNRNMLPWKSVQSVPTITFATDLLPTYVNSITDTPILLPQWCFWHFLKHLHNRTLNTSFVIYSQRLCIFPWHWWSAWCLGQNLLRFFEQKVLQKTFGPVLETGWKNSKIYKLHAVYDDVKIIKFGTLRSAGHVLRTEKSDPAKKVICTKQGGNGDRERGRQKMMWCNEIGGGHHMG